MTIQEGNAQPLIGKLLDEFSELPVLWGLNEPGALVRHSDVFKMLVAAGKTYLAAVPPVTAAEQPTEPVPSKITDGDSARSFVAAWHREHFPTDRTFTNYIMGRNRHCALAGDFAWQLAKALESMESAHLARQSPAPEPVEVAQEVTQQAAKAETAEQAVSMLSGALNHARDALRFYAEQQHFHMHQPDEWDTVSGEPQNFYEDSNHTATVEDGSVAKQALENVACVEAYSSVAPTTSTVSALAKDRKLIGELEASRDGYKSQLEHLSNAQDAIKDQALEEAAKVAEDTDVATYTHAQVLHDDGSQTRSDIVAAIRALKRTAAHAATKSED